MQSLTRKFLAGFYVCLLLSAHTLDAHRISRTFAASRGSGSQDRRAKSVIELSSLLLSKGLYGGGEVCKPSLFTNPEASVQRFEYKLGKFKHLLNDVMNNPTIAKASELRQRALRFQKCFRLVDISAMPLELKSLVVSTSKGSLTETLRSARSDTLRNLKDMGMFPSEGKCSFNPDQVDILSIASSGNPDRVLSAQLFGESCQTVSGVLYRDGRTKVEQKLIGKMSLMYTDELKAALGPLSAGEISRVNEKLEQDCEELLNSVESPGSSLIQAESDVYSNALLIVLVCIFILAHLFYATLVAVKVSNALDRDLKEQRERLDRDIAERDAPAAALKRRQQGKKGN